MIVCYGSNRKPVDCPLFGLITIGWTHVMLSTMASIWVRKWGTGYHCSQTQTHWQPFAQSTTRAQQEVTHWWHSLTDTVLYFQCWARNPAPADALFLFLWVFAYHFSNPFSSKCPFPRKRSSTLWSEKLQGILSSREPLKTFKSS